MAPTGHQHRRRRADAERSLASILEAAVACLAVSPDASMTEIAKAAGVGRVTLYGHFTSRDELRHAAIGHVVEALQAAFDARALDDLPPAEALEQMLRTSWRVIELHRAFFMAVMHGHEHEAMNHHRSMFERIERVIARGQADGVFRTDLDRQWLVAVCVGLVHAAVQYADNGQTSNEHAMEALLATTRAVFRPND
jgi:TetR/AcrR family transcriptional regulator, mexCD-oprJ operon repressor